MADGLAAIDGVEVVNDVVYTQVMFRLGTDDETRALGAALLAEGTAVVTGAEWRGHATQRCSMSSWATTPEDAHRIFDALNWAHSQWPDMALATTGAKGAEQFAIKWSRQKGVKLILAKADFDRNGKAAPFRANDEMIDLEPACCFTLAHTLNTDRAAGTQPFGPALNLAQKAQEHGVKHIPIRLRA